MSRSLVWRPLPKDPPPGEYLDVAIAFALKEAYLHWTDDLPVDLGLEAIPFLKGLNWNASEDLTASIELLIAAIEEHGRVILEFEH